MKILIIVCYQFDMVEGALGFPKAKGLDEKIVSIIDTYDDFIFVLDKHKTNFDETLLGKMIGTPYNIENTEGMEVYGRLKDYIPKAKKVFYKETYPSLDLANYLKDHQEFSEVDLVGIVSHLDVFSNAIMVKSALPDAIINVKKEYVETFDKSLEQKSFNVLNGLLIESR